MGLRRVSMTDRAVPRWPVEDKVAQCLKAHQQLREYWILSCGSGDGSQPVDIVKHGHRNICVAFFDTREAVVEKYGEVAEKNLEYLRGALGDSLVKFEIDATKLESYELGAFDTVMFWFPHTGVPNSRKDEQLHSNRRLLKGFGLSVPSVLKPHGEVQVALKTNAPYDEWEVRQLAGALAPLDSELVLRSECPLDKSLFPSYVHRMTKGCVGTKATSVLDDDARLYCFGFAKECTSGDLVETVRPSIHASLKHLQASICILVLGSASSWTDDDVSMGVQEILRTSGSPLDKLAIRREFGTMCSAGVTFDARQVNRVLYLLKREGRVDQLPPLTISNKPRWRLSLTSSGTS
jgi:hypothetical protein